MMLQCAAGDVEPTELTQGRPPNGQRNAGWRVCSASSYGDGLGLLGARDRVKVFPGIPQQKGI